MNKGFTLIELLAVLIILSFIALITTPIVFDIINNSKKESTIKSVNNYLDAVEIAIASENVHSETETLDGIYTISNDGKTLTRDDETIIILDYSGNGIMEGSLVVKNGLVKQIIDGKIEDWYVKIISDKVELVDEINTGNTLLTGREFNVAIKQLANSDETEEITIDYEDTIITSIEFYAYGVLPVGYTIDELKQLSNVDVSVNQDKSVTAYYDNGKVYVYSNDAINLNLDSNNMFSLYRNLATIDIILVNTSNVQNMSSMFGGCWSLSKLELENFDTSNVTDMTLMFSACRSLTTLDVSSFDTSSVTNMGLMFLGCESLTTLNLSTFDTRNVTDMNAMFGMCTNLTCIQVGDNWSTEQAITTSMFESAGTSTTQTDSCKVTSS